MMYKFRSRKFMKTTFITLTIVIASAFYTNAQEERSVIREGNKFFEQKEFEKAELNYKRALELNEEESNIWKNLGAAQYLNGNFYNADSSFNKTLEYAKTNKEKANAYYNIGNTRLQAGDYENSIKAYQNALKLDPTHDQSRYNMAVATKIQEQQQGGSGEKQQQDKNQQNKEGQSKDQNNNKDKKEEGQGNQDKEKDGEKDKNEKNQPQPKENQMTREEMERFLESLQQKEKDVQKKLEKEKFEKQQRVVEKEW
jgi:Ca-activated chloride channel homolog